MTAPLLEVRGLSVEFLTPRGRVQAVHDVSFALSPGETLGLVGESGSGKSVLAQAVMGLVQLPGRITAGEVRWRGVPLSATERGRLNGRQIAIVFQDPMTSLNPVMQVGEQIAEVLRHHLGLSRAAAAARTSELLALVGIPAPEVRARQYPHQFSGGMRQRAMIAMALAGEPALLIADEPTTALDVTIQDQIIRLLADLRDRLGLAILLITHDLGLVAALCDRVAVAYAGRLREVAPAEALFARPAHPYTAGLLRSTPRLTDRQERMLAIDGSPPDLLSLPPGCAFAPRCPVATAECGAVDPPLAELGAGRAAACLRPFAASVAGA
jgi:oligopeptide/dipeptide ABC transporter ATP-binding protein